MRAEALLAGLILTFSSSIQSQSIIATQGETAKNHISLVPDHSVVQECHSQEHGPTKRDDCLKQARLFYENGHFEKSYLHYSKVIHLRYLIQSADYLRYARILQGLNKNDSAIWWTNKYLDLEPRNEEAQNLLYQLHLATRYYNERTFRQYIPITQSSHTTGTLVEVNTASGSSSYVLTNERIIEVKGSQSLEWLYQLLEDNSIEIRQRVTINPVWYQPGQIYPDRASQSELIKLSVLMKKYKFIEFEIRSHTDETGSDLFNLRLSQSRAKAARDFLLARDIQTERLLASGYGEDQPVCQPPTCSEKQQGLNRRTEFRMVYIDDNRVVSNY